MADLDQLEQAIVAQESLRGTLGDAIVDATISVLHEKLNSLKSKPQEQQRKLATVLFADVSGFTAMSEKMDAEDVNDIMNALWERLDKAITNFGGYIDKHIGDAVMAIWGAEIARENDPEQAIHAALAMQSELAGFRNSHNVTLAMRIGINTGLVLLGEVGTTGEFTAIGDTVNVASRLEHAASVGSILISHNTYRHVRGIFDVEPLEAIKVKGKVEPLQGYNIQRAKPRAFRRATRGVEGVETQMIAREEELNQLKTALESVLKTGTIHTVAIVGEAGIGKSRLLYEFENWVDLLPQKFSFFKGRAGQETQHLPFALLKDLFLFRFQINEDEPSKVAHQVILNGVEVVLKNQPQSELKAHFIGQLLGFDLKASPHLQGVLHDPRQIYDRALVYLIEFFRELATQRPIVILLEDIHWADESSLDIINRIARALRKHRAILINTTRPTLFEKNAQWKNQPIFQTIIPLSPLSQDASFHLVGEILKQAENIPGQLLELIANNAEGNPYYIEEIIKMLIEDSIILKDEQRWHVPLDRFPEIHIPPTLTGVLQARLESLTPSEQLILQQASVIGRIFWDSAVQFISQNSETRLQKNQVLQALIHLQVREMVFKRESSAFSESNEHIFKHALMQEVAYQSVLKRARHVYHALAAEWLLEQRDARKGEHAGLIAAHKEAAGKADQAVEFFIEAGEQASGQYANSEAVDYYNRALVLVSENDFRTRYNILKALEHLNDLLGNRESQLANLSEMRDIAEQFDVPDKKAEAAVLSTNFSNTISEYQQAAETAQHAIQIAASIGNKKLEAEGYLAWSMAMLNQADYPAAQKHTKTALQLANSSGLKQLLTRIYRQFGALHQYQENYPQALRYYEKSLTIAREIGDRRGEGMILNNLGIVAHFQGQAMKARGYFEGTLEIFREIGDRLSEGYMVNNLGVFAQSLGDFARAQALYREAVVIHQEVNNKWGEGNALKNLASLFEHQKEYAQAKMFIEPALEILKEVGDLWLEALALSNLGDTLTGLGEFDQALEAYHQSLDQLKKLGNQQTAFETQAGIARLELTRGRPDHAKIHIDTLLTYLEEGNNLDGTESPFRIHLTCYEVLKNTHNPRAIHFLTQTYHLLQARAAAIPDKETRRNYLNNIPWHRELVALWEAHQQDK